MRSQIVTTLTLCSIAFCGNAVSVPLDSDGSLVQRAFLAVHEQQQWTGPSAEMMPSPLLIYGFVMSFVATLIVAIFWRHGLTTILPVMMYIGALSTMTIQLREVFTDKGFNFPRFVTACHFFGAALVTGTVLAAKKHLGGDVTVINAHTFKKGVLPAAMCFTLSIGFANLGIAYTNAHFYEMVEGGTVLITAGIAFLIGKPTAFMLIAILMVTIMGQSMCWTGELHFSAVGFVLLVLSAVCRATKGVLNQLLMSNDGELQSLRPLELTFYSSLTCLCMMLPWALVSEGLHPFQSVMSNRQGVTCPLLLTMVTACVIQVSGASVIRSIGAVAAQLTGSIKGFLSVLGAWAALGEQISSRQWLGYIIVVASIAAYNRMDSMLKEAEKRDGTKL
jgi:drug/metabolite transporter (DMT)-like permease